MFEFLKKIFAKEEELAKEIVHPGKLKEWVLGKSEGIEKGVKERIALIRKELSERMTSVRESAKALQEAELRNPNISLREIQFMQGNRKFYVQKTEYLLKQIEDLLENELTFFIKNYHESLDNFAKSTSRAYAILQEFFAVESRDIASKIKGLDGVVGRLKDDEQIKRHGKIDAVKKELISYENKLKKKEELAGEIKALKDGISLLKKDKEEAVKKKEGIVSSDEYKVLASLDEKKSVIGGKIKSLRDKIYSDFSLLQRPLRKYQRIAFQNEKLVEHYSVDAFNALVTDSGFKIVEILKAMTKSINDGKLGLKDRKTERVLDIISSLDERYFTGIVNSYNLLVKEKREINNKIEESKLNEELNSVDEKIGELTNKEEIKKTRIKLLNDELNSIDIEQALNKIKEDIEKILNVRVEFRE